MSPCVFGQRGAYGTGGGIGQVADVGDVALVVFHGHREHASGAFDDFGIHQAGQAGTVDRG